MMMMSKIIVIVVIGAQRIRYDSAVAERSNSSTTTGGGTRTRTASINHDRLWSDNIPGPCLVGLERGEEIFLGVLEIVFGVAPSRVVLTTGCRHGTEMRAVIPAAIGVDERAVCQAWCHASQSEKEVLE